MTLDELKVLITADASQLRNEVKHLQGYIDNFGNQSQKATKGLKVGFDEDSKSAEGTKSSVDNVSKAIGSMDKLSKAAFAAMISSSAAVNTAIQGMANVANAFGDAFSNQLTLLGESALDLGRSIMSIAPEISKVLTAIYQLKNGSDTLTAEQQARINNLTTGVSRLGDRIQMLGQSFQDTAQTVAGTTDEVVEDIKSNIQEVRQEVDQVNEDISSEGSEAASKIAINWKKIGSSILSALSAAGRFVKMHNPISKMAKSLTKLFSRLKETILSAFIFSAVSSWFYEMKDRINAYLKLNTTLQSNLSQLKGAFLTAFQPIYELAVPALEKLTASLIKVMSGLAALTAKLTGTTVSANKKAAESLYNEASAFAASGKAAEKAKKQIMGFDELNVISSSDKGSTAAAEDQGPSFDFPEVDPGQLDIFAKFEELFGKLPGLLDSINPKIMALIESFNQLLDRILNSNLGETLVAVFGALGTNLTSVIQALDWEQLGTFLVEGLNTLIRSIDAFFSNVDWLGMGKGIMDSIMAIIENFDPSALMSAISTILESAIDLVLGLIYNLDFGSIFNFIWDTIQALLSELINGNLIPKLMELLGAAVGAIIKWVIQWTVAEVKARIGQWKDLFAFFQGYIDEAGGNVALGLLNAIWNGFKNIVSWVKDKLILPLLDGILKGFGLEGGVGEFGQIATKLWGDFTTGLSNGWTKVKDWFSNTWKKVTGKIADIWKKITGFFGKIKDAIKSFFNDVVNFFRTPINAIIGFINKLISGVIGGINNMIRALNKLSFDVPDWVPVIGGKKFGFNIGYLTAPQIPYLAKGGIVSQPTLAMIGESGKEAVVPLENNTEWIDTLVEKLGGQSPSRLVLEVDGKELGWAAIRNINNITKQTGGLPLVIA